MKKKKIKIRRVWKIKPATRIEKDVMKYDRRRAKRELRRANDTIVFPDE